MSQLHPIFILMSLGTSKEAIACVRGMSSLHPSTHPGLDRPDGIRQRSLQL